MRDVRMFVVGAAGLGAMLVMAGIVAGGASGGGDDRIARPAVASETPEPSSRPEACTRVAPRHSLQTVIDNASAGDVLCLEEGRWRGRFVVDESVALVGTGESVIVNEGGDSTIRVEADDVTIEGLVVSGSGEDAQQQDAGVFVAEADGVTLRRLRLRDVLYGVAGQQADGLTVHGSSITCRHDRALGRRGDGLRLWEVRHSTITGNIVDHCRDIVAWYSPGNFFANNEVRDGRYGIHFMYSSRNIVRRNRFVGNVVGTFVMYSRHLLVDHNVFAESGGSGGMGLGLKESGNLEITRNRFVGNTEGVYVDTSPLQREDRLLFALNAFRFGNAGVSFHNTPHHTGFFDNVFRDNQEVVRVEGGGEATGAEWAGNVYGRYAGYDFDGDGIGDVPFEYRTASGTLLSKAPNLRVLHGTPALFLIEAASRVAPRYQPKLLLRDERPRMARPDEMFGAERLEAVRERRGFLEVRRREGRPYLPDEGSHRSGDY